jgi:hypothetical protein
MTPRQYIEEKETALRRARADAWIHPLSKSRERLRGVLDSMNSFKIDPKEVPLIIKLVENPKYDIGLFAGSVSLFTHDCIHVLLGRGLAPKDEAFVIGYTMGSTKKMFRWRRNLFMFASKHLYPKGYRFGEEERYVFYSGIMAGGRCLTDLSKVDFKEFADYKISAIRERLGVSPILLKHYYHTEKDLFPYSGESQRLV